MASFIPEQFSKMSLEDVGEGRSGETSRTAGRGSASPGTSGAAEGESVAEHLSLEDFRTLLELLKIKLPENVLDDDDAVNRSRKRKFSGDADDIVQKLKSGDLTVAPKPRLQCGKVDQALKLKSQDNLRDLTEMIFLNKRKQNQKTLTERWEQIPLETRRGLRMKETITRSESADVQKKRRSNKLQSQRNEMKCFHYFIQNMKLSDPDHDRERAIEFGFLSGRMDFLIKTNSRADGTSDYIILECKGKKKDLNPPEGQEAESQSEQQYKHQTQAYLYMLKKKYPKTDSVRAAIVIREYQEDDEDEEEIDEDKCRSIDVEDAGETEDLNNYCKDEALPLFLAALNRIFQKEQKKK